MASRRESEMSISKGLYPKGATQDPATPDVPASGLKSKLLELLHSADIGKDDLNVLTAASASPLTPESSLQGHESHDSLVNKEILLEEAVMIQKLHQWIQLKGDGLRTDEN